MTEVHYIENEYGPPTRLEVVERTADTITYRRPEVTDAELNAAIEAAAELIDEADEDPHAKARADLDAAIGRGHAVTQSAVDRADAAAAAARQQHRNTAR
jgi:hypothetical protein